MKNNNISLSLFSMLLCILFATVVSAKDNDLLLSLSLTGNSQKVTGTGVNGTVQAWHYVSNIADQDNNATTNPDRYRQKGLIGGAIRYYKKDTSYTQFKNAVITKRHSQLGVALLIKFAKPASSISDLIANRTDAGKDGFAIFVWGNKLRIQYGDGKKRYDMKFSASKLRDGKWHRVIVGFDKGEVTAYVDGKKVGNKKTSGKYVAKGSHKLTLGSYPINNKGRKNYAFNGWIDEVIVTKSLQSAREALKQKIEQTDKIEELIGPPVSGICQPVEGYQQFFDGKAVFNTFHSQPVPLTFMMKGDKKRIQNLALVLYLPKSIKLRQAFQSNHNRKDFLVKMKRKNTKIDGKQYVRYQTANNLLSGLSSKFGSSYKITVALDASKSVKDGKVYWAMLSGNKEYGKKHFEVKFLKPRKVPSKSQRGKFQIMGYFLNDDMAFHGKKLQKEVADLYLASGIIGKGAFYNRSSRRGKFDKYLQSRGFTLYNISLWSGPLTGRATHEVPNTMGKNGKVIKNRRSPIEALNSKKFKKYYDKVVAKKIKKNGPTKYIIFDYEPWSWARKFGFDKQTLEQFRKQYNISKSVEPKEILSKYRKQWTQFWVNISTKTIALMADASHKADPDIKTISYTYFYNYDNKKKLWQRFWGIPKDPRQTSKYLDEVMLSAYHINGRKLFDSLRMSKRYIHDADISVIASLQRANEISAITPKEVLSPEQMKQKIIMCAALGVKRFGLWRGLYIDGAFHIAMGKASQLIWAHENFYYNGRNIRSQIEVFPVNNDRHTKEDFAYTAQEYGGKQLITLFNFTDRPMKFKVNIKNAPTQQVTVATHGAKLIQK